YPMHPVNHPVFESRPVPEVAQQSIRFCQSNLLPILNGVEQYFDDLHHLTDGELNLKLHPNHFVGSAGRLDSADSDCVDSDLVESEISSNDPIPIREYLPDHPAVKIAFETARHPMPAWPIFPRYYSDSSCS